MTKYWITLLLIVVSAARFSDAQDAKGVLELRFVDRGCGDKPVEGVVVTLKGPVKIKKVKSDRSGIVNWRNLVPGNYTIVADRLGFMKHIYEVSIVDGAIVERTYNLKPGWSSDYYDAISEPGFDRCKHPKKVKRSVHIP